MDCDEHDFIVVPHWHVYISKCEGGRYFQCIYAAMDDCSTIPLL